MEKFEINYSKKNIPISSKNQYKLMLTSKVEKVLKRMRWKVLEFLGKLDNDSQKETYGFKSLKCPPAITELADFENDMMLMVKNVQFRQICNTFQNKLKSDIDEIKKSDKVFVSADKSRNIYKMEKDQYQKLLTENVTKTYKKSSIQKLNNINGIAKQIAQKLTLEDRIEVMQEDEAYITIKDHKDEFPNKITCRLINPSKSSIGRISKHILDKINSQILLSKKLNQWKDTSDVIEWYKAIDDKQNSSFIQFDIESFYPSIKKELFDNAILFAKTITDISDEELNIIMESRKTLLFNNEIPWVKKEGNENFDVPMGCYDGAEVCEIVGSYLLNLLCEILDKEQVGLYRDDGLAVVKHLSGPQIEQKRKNIIKIFKDNGLNITIQANLKVVKFLDVELNLNNGIFRPYRKPDNIPVYINKKSNHPSTVLKQLPESISKRISDISSNEYVYKNSIPTYAEALKKSGFTGNLTFTPKVTSTTTSNEEKKRKRKIIWFNPPYCMSVKSNIGKTFLSLLRKHFPKGSALNKIFNKNTVKVSYSCMGNIASVISAHNKNILQPNKNNTWGCNCRVKDNCPLENKCLTPTIVYKATVMNNANDESKFYYGVSETPFKERFRNHTKEFKHAKYRNSTELSKYIWKLKDASITPLVSWEIAAKVYSKTKIDYCKLCLTEKLFIINCFNDHRLLNKKSELVNSCRHRNKLLLKQFKDKKRNDTMD